MNRLITIKSRQNRMPCGVLKGVFTKTGKGAVYLTISTKEAQAIFETLKQYLLDLGFPLEERKPRIPQVSGYYSRHKRLVKDKDEKRMFLFHE